MNTILALIAALVLVATSAARAQTPDPDDFRYVWTSDPAHSSVVFETTHWGVVDIVGWFEDYEIRVFTNREDFSDAVVTARIALDSVRMPNPGMAANLRNLFFVTTEHPEATFVSSMLKPADEPGTHRLTGLLTMKDVGVEVTWKVRFNGYASPPQGAPGFKAQAELNRLDYGVGDLAVMLDTQVPTVAPVARVTVNLRLEYTGR